MARLGTLPVDDLYTRARCTHPQCSPAFDGNNVRGMTAIEVRVLYPRFSGVCPDCGQRVIVYASFEHYIAGDW